jgi:hypothetical protein
MLQPNILKTQVKKFIGIISLWFGVGDSKHETISELNRLESQFIQSSRRNYNY